MSAPGRSVARLIPTPNPEIGIRLGAGVNDAAASYPFVATSGAASCEGYVWRARTEWRALVAGRFVGSSTRNQEAACRAAAASAFRAGEGLP